MDKYKKKYFLIIALIIAVPSFMWQQVAFWGVNAKAEDPAVVTPVNPQIAIDAAAKQAEIDAAKKDTQNNISDVQKKMDKVQAAKDKLQQNLYQIQQSVSNVKNDINKTKSIIQDTAANISRKEAEVNNINDQISLQKNLLTSLMRQIYYNQGQPILNAVLSSKSFADVFSDTDHLLTVEDKVKEISNNIAENKATLEGDKAQLADLKQQHEQTLAVKAAQQQSLVSTQNDVQGAIQEKDATIGELQQKLAELQSDLNVLTGKSYNASDIYDAISYASKQTNVPEGVLYGFLKRETNLGANTGQCTYADVEKVSIAGYKKYGKKYQNSIDLLYKREGLYNGIIKDLGYNKNKKVSCTIPFSSAGPNQGGAMGVAQFMSDIWLSYKSRIAAKTGSANPDPWDLTDGVMALAIKVQGAGATSSSAAGIKKAVTNYYGIFSQGYYDTVYYWAKNYDRLINN